MSEKLKTTTIEVVEPVHITYMRARRRRIKTRKQNRHNKAGIFNERNVFRVEHYLLKAQKQARRAKETFNYYLKLRFQYTEEFKNQKYLTLEQKEAEQKAQLSKIENIKIRAEKAAQASQTLYRVACSFCKGDNINDICLPLNCNEVIKSIITTGKIE